MRPLPFDEYCNLMWQLKKPTNLKRANPVTEKDLAYYEKKNSIFNIMAFDRLGDHINKWRASGFTDKSRDKRRDCENEEKL